MNGDETRPLPPMPSPGPQQPGRGSPADSEARRQDLIPTAEIPLRPQPPVRGDTPTAPVPPPLVQRVKQTPARPPAALPPPTGYIAARNDTPATPFPQPRRDTTEPFGAVLAVPGQDETRPVPAPGAGPTPKTTLAFGGVLPIPAAQQAPAPQSLQPGSTVGAFSLLACEQEGAAFTVYQAEHAQHGRVRLSVVTEAAAPHAQAFLLEARLQTTLDDPRLVRVHGLGANPRPWIASDPCEGPTLGGELSRGALEPMRAARLLREVALALDHAHSRRVVHGDLRPEHVFLLGPDGVRLSGFGQLTAIGPDGALCSYPGGPRLGNAPHASPARMRGEPRRREDDVYSLGALLYHALVGRPPFHGTPAEVKRGVLDHSVTLPSAPAGSVLASLCAVAARSLSKRPDERYATARAFAEALEPALEAPAPAARGAAGTLVAVLLVALVLVVAVVVGVLTFAS